MNDRRDDANAADQHGNGGDEIREIRESIEQTRAQMSQTIGELQDRLSPAHIKAQIREQVRQATIGKVENMAQRANDTMADARQSIVGTISANPIPAALVGIGLAWLWINRRSGSSDSRQSYGRGGDEYDTYATSFRNRYSPPLRDDFSDPELGYRREAQQDLSSRTGEAVSGVVGQIRDRGSELAARAKDRVSGAVDQAQQRAGQVVDQARQTAGRVVDQAQQRAVRVMNSAQQQASQAQERFNVAMDDNPLAVGAIALAVGTAIGLALPQTRKENEWMGETRDNLLDTARSAVQDATQQVRHVARDATANANDQQQFQSGTAAPGTM